MRIALIRHGMTEGNKHRRYIGKTDEPLADTDCLDLDYPDCDFVVASPMKRCLQTARFIYPDKEIRVCADLAECDFGAFENKSYEELKENPDYMKWLESGGKLPFPDGEAHGDFVKRCVRGFYASLPENAESVAFVIHGGSIMAVMQSVFGGGFYDYQIRNGGMFLLGTDGEKVYAREE